MSEWNDDPYSNVRWPESRPSEEPGVPYQPGVVRMSPRRKIITDEHLREIADNLLRQVVCSCGNYRHHGVNWMPEGSGEGLIEAVAILRALVNEANEPRS